MLDVLVRLQISHLLLVVAHRAEGNAHSSSLARHTIGGRMRLFLEPLGKLIFHMKLWYYARRLLERFIRR